MIDIILGFFRELHNSPVWVVIWVYWLMIINTLCIAFIREKEAKMVLAAWIVAPVLMMGMYHYNGFNKFLGLAHIIPWVPMVVYLIKRYTSISPEGNYIKYITALLITTMISLVMDIYDVILYLMG